MVRKIPKRSTTRRLHRFLGAGAAVFIVFMVLSGITINHSNRLGLAQGRVSQAFLLDWYGLEGPEYIHSFAVGNDWISFAGSQLYFNDKAVSTVTSGLGAVASHGMLVAAGSEELILIDNDGQLIERIPWTSRGAGPIESIGLLADGSVVVRSAGQFWSADAELLSWQRAGDTVNTRSWSIPGSAPAILQQHIAQHYRGDGLSLQRLLLDFHSGRIFGSVGVVIYDLLALAVGFLAISGLVLWLRGRRNGNRKR
jgi:hypothetical protein